MKSLRWFALAVVAGSAASMTLATMANRRRQRTAAAQAHAQRSDLHSWENEGGNVAPASGAAVSP